MVEQRYVNALGWFGWLVVARLLRGTPTRNSSVEMFDRMVPLLSRIENHVKLPLGQSAFMVAERPVDD